MISAHLPALQVVLPLFAAPVALLLGRARLAWVFGSLVGWATFAISIVLLSRVVGGDTIHYQFGGWATPWGIGYVIDELSAYLLVIVSGVAAIVFPYALTSVKHDVPEERHPLFYTAALLCLAGLLGMIATGDAFNAFVFLEISSLATYTLIAMGRDRRALTASYQYLIMGTIGATFFLIGVGLLYMLTGTLNMADLAQRLPPLVESRTMQAAFAFLVVGLGLKIAMFPLHLWLPNAYTYAPAAVTAFLAGSSTKVSVYLLIRFLFDVFGQKFSFDAMQVHWIFLVLAVLALLTAPTVAIFQTDVRRLLAYSSIAQVGYVVLGIALDNVTGLTSAILHLFNHAVMKTALFMAVGAIMFRLGSAKIEDMAGIGKTMPWTMAAFVIGGLSLVGVPLTVGFISKWYLVQGIFDHGWWPLAILVLFTSLLAVVYIWRVVETAYFHEPTERVATLREAPLELLIPTWILVAANVYFGVYTDLSVGVAHHASEVLLLTGASR